MKNIFCQLTYNSSYSLIFIILSFVFVILSSQVVSGDILKINTNNQVQQKKLKDFNFVTAGDFGCSDRVNTTIANMMAKKPELMLALGDLSYQRTGDCWLDIVSPLETEIPLKMAFGEHDIGVNLTKYNDYINHFNMSKPYYSFDHQNVHFLALATAKNKVIPYLNGSEQYEFVKQDLRNAHNNENIDWIIVYAFRTFYSSNSTHPSLDKLHELYHPLFEKYGVDIVFQAHNHNYQRTYPLSFNESSSSRPIVTDKDTRKYKDPKGPIFVTVGTGGKDLHDFTGQAPYVIRQFMRHGFLNVDITDNGSKLIGTFYENREFKDKDHFTFKKKIKD